MDDAAKLSAAREAAESFLETQLQAQRERSFEIFDADFEGGSGMTEAEFLDALDEIHETFGDCRQMVYLGHALAADGTWRFLWRAESELGDGINLLGVQEREGGFRLVESFYLDD